MSFVIKNKLSPETIGLNKELMEILNKVEPEFKSIKYKNKLVDINTMMFVAIHEMGHLASKEIGHVPPFWDNMKFLLEVGIELGIYSKTDYAAAPVSYCGTKITDTPLDL